LVYALFALVNAAELPATTVIMQFDVPPSERLWRTLKYELENNLSGNQGTLRVFARNEVQTGASFAQLAMVRVVGACTVSNTQSAGHPAPLGWVNIVDGAYLSYAYADCARLGECVRRTMPVLHRENTDVLLATALSHVIRHELRHISLQTATHQRQGEFKAALSSAELISRK
jgi:hypothetical protein